MTADERRVTIAAIAQAAGVSVPTVSRVLNGRTDVAPATRERVEQLLRDQGYRRRNSRRPGRAQVLDMVFDELDSPWAVELIRGVADVAHAAGVGTVVSAVHQNEAATRQWLRNLRSRTCDGVSWWKLAAPFSQKTSKMRLFACPAATRETSKPPDPWSNSAEKAA